ncbi:MULTISPECIES: DNA-directed RNA polymerase subunit alpha C-terminal domain-containing protein [Blautia]|uniref:DNA-directed RNA polymerase subunit alpha C-terminal domain-containing protein n=1 Tax=Blautia TaxID=572511 RepID=UPI001D0B86AE|nr:DNA-directed RNA polymerase subunit alpha C-terminal domain-containing protein [Blautia sp. DFI.1.216]MCB8723942.1 hypothetical protein [Blautia sp. DFI.1.216]
MDYKNEILKVEKKQFELYFCDAYIKTLHPSEASYYKKHLITWRKVKHLIIKKKFALLEESAACVNIYKEFWRNFFDVAKEQKTPLEYLFLSTEINNCLRRQKLVYIEDLLSQYNTIDDLLKIRKIGEKAAKDIINKLNEFTSIDKKTIDKQIMENNEDCYVLYEERDKLLHIVK